MQAVPYIIPEFMASTVFVPNKPFGGAKEIQEVLAAFSGECIKCNLNSRNNNNSTQFTLFINGCDCCSCTHINNYKRFWISGGCCNSISYQISTNLVVMINFDIKTGFDARTYKKGFTSK